MKLKPSRLRDVFDGVRQRRYPPEFRIARPAWPTDVLVAIERTLRDTPAPNEVLKSLDPHALAETVTSLWRAERKMLVSNTDDLPREFRQAIRHLQSTWDVLKEAGVEVQDHVGLPFDSGLSIEVIAFQPSPGIEREMVIDAIKPTIYLKEERIQVGQVVVGVPEEESTS